MTLMLDTHVLLWLSVAPSELSPAARRAIEGSNDPAVAAITWWELAWMAAHGRVTSRIPTRAWFDDLGRAVRTLPLTPAIAQTAAGLPPRFPRDPVDRLIYATALETGCRLVTKDGRHHEHDRDGAVVVW